MLVIVVQMELEVGRLLIGLYIDCNPVFDAGGFHKDLIMGRSRRVVLLRFGTIQFANDGTCKEAVMCYGHDILFWVEY
jgi:hypothetical protein